MKVSMKYLYLLAIALMPAFTACNEDEESTLQGDKPGYDITELDGKVTTLQTATAGNGINIILMGDAFTAEDINNGTYDDVMNKAMEALFTTQPIKSLRQYFNVYSVQKVSIGNQLTGQTALGTTIDGDLIGGPCDVESSGNRSKTMFYASAVPGYDESNTFIGVVINSDISAGITSYPNGYSTMACAYSTLAGSVDGDAFRQLLTHELVGHGIGKLADEYKPRGGFYTEAAIEDYKEGQKATHGFYQNISLRAQTRFAPWNSMIKDFPEENLSCYLIASDESESSNVYKPTEVSIMSDTTTPGMTFNAPSRYSIYVNIMKLATGETPTYDDFLAFDAANK